MLSIRRAILHSFDFETGICHLSDSELDVSQRPVRSFVQRHVRKARMSPELRRGEFAERSAFAERLRGYLSRTGEGSFAELSVEIAQWFWEELRRAEALDESDILIAEFDDTGEASSASGMSDEELAAAFEGQADGYLAVLLLPRRQGFVHDMQPGGTSIARTGALLPNPTQKLESYAIVNERTLAIDYADKPRSVGSVERMLIPDGFLQCSSEASSKEAIEEVVELVEEIAAERPHEAPAYVAAAKARIVSHADTEERFSPAEIGREVFEDAPELAEKYERTVESKRLPDEVSVRRGAATRLAKSHRIRTDTGIEIIFPSDLPAREGRIEFAREDDGHVSIIIKGVARIENR